MNNSSEQLKHAYSPGLNIQFSAISLFHLILPKAGFHFHLRQMRSVLANSVYQLEGPWYLFVHNISRDICPISRHHRSDTFGLAGLNTADLKMASIRQWRLELSSPLKDSALCTAGALSVAKA